MRSIKFVITLFLSIALLSCSRKVLVSDNIKFPQKVKNVMIHEANTFVGPCEPSISIDPTDTKNLVAGSILDNVYISKDGGLTWTQDKLKSSLGVYGDPVVRHMNNGHVLYAHLSNPTGKAYSSEEFLDRIVVQKSMDQGTNWTDGTYPAGDFKKDHDKHWIGTAKKGGQVIMTWTEFDTYGSKDSLCFSKILFSKSTDYGDSWSKPKTISKLKGNCIDSDDTTEGAVPCIDNNGNYYVSWSYGEKIFFDKSTDGGKTWKSTDDIIAEQIGGWDIKIPGIGRCNGMPITEVDQSSGKYQGSVYVNWSDQRNGENDTDIWLKYSRDGGNTWSNDVRVNDDLSGKHQFFSWMDIDQVTGHIYIVYYDRRDHSDENTDVYLAHSTDGGQNFTNTKISESPFKPNKQVFFGDYNDISAHNGMIRPIWTRLDGFKLSVWTALIDIN